MEPLLGFFLFSAFLRTGDSLECEMCVALGRGCYGPQGMCPAGLDTCAVAFTETIAGGRQTYNTVKGCERSSACQQEPIILNFGPGQTQRNGFSCCEGNECNSIQPQLPPFNTTTNGKRCPACFSAAGSCYAETVQCTGFDDYCFRFVMQADGLEIITKGCTRKSSCERLKAAEGLLGGMSEVDCHLAGQSSLPSGSLFLALSLLLGMKTLF